MYIFNINCGLCSLQTRLMLFDEGKNVNFNTADILTSTHGNLDYLV